MATLALPVLSILSLFYNKKKKKKKRERRAYFTETSVLFTSANFIPIGLCMCFPPHGQRKAFTVETRYSKVVLGQYVSSLYLIFVVTVEVKKSALTNRHNLSCRKILDTKTHYFRLQTHYQRGNPYLSPCSISN